MSLDITEIYRITISDFNRDGDCDVVFRSKILVKLQDFRLGIIISSGKMHCNMDIDLLSW